MQKMEREKLEKLRRKADKDKAEAAKKKAAVASKGDKVRFKPARCFFFFWRNSFQYLMICCRKLLRKFWILFLPL